MHPRLLLGASLAITIIIGGLAVVAFSINRSAQNTGELPAGMPLLQPNEQEQDQFEIPRPEITPMLKLEEEFQISIDEISDWAIRSGYEFKLPLDTHGLTMQSIVPLGLGSKPRDDPESRVGEIRVLFAQQPISRYTLEEFVGDGGFMLLIQMRRPAFQEYVEEHRDTQIVTSVNGNLAIYEPPFPLEPEPIIRFTWVDGNSKFQLVASADHFSMEDIISIAESLQ